LKVGKHHKPDAFQEMSFQKKNQNPTQTKKTPNAKPNHVLGYTDLTDGRSGMPAPVLFHILMIYYVHINA